MPPRNAPPVPMQDQPHWARQMLGKEEIVDGPDFSKSGLRPETAIRSRADLLTSLGQSGGGGLVLDQAILEAYPGATVDIEELVRSGTVRFVACKGRHRGLRKGRGKGNPVVNGEVSDLLDGVIFAVFEPEVEALRVDGDVRDAYHAAPRPQAGDVRMVLGPVPEDNKAARKRQRRNVSRKIVQNSHMNIDS
eukprot:TRINITY_DN43070_c0_g1_i1.p1 TRINITY_DN43070_c0_g1~~TRINITY_DN43070_c0_g1_i1.p1  ORF type:complete len:192 (-),score=20.02 TRINITY_DN43070_c0_g1_i1:125-700(-)